MNVNIAATSVGNYRKLKDAGIGTCILFQETYHKESYEVLHPTGRSTITPTIPRRWTGPWRAESMMWALGVLFGLDSTNMSFAGLLMHAEHLEAVLGVGPSHHQRSAYQACRRHRSSAHFDNSISDDIFAKLCALIRLAVPYTGMIISTRRARR